MRHVAMIAGLGAVLAGCAGAPPAPSRFIEVTTTPPGAQCQAVRRGEPVGQIAATPGTLGVTPSGRQILLTCTLAGHLPTRVRIDAGADPARTAMYLVGGGVGGLIGGTMSGDTMRYPASVSSRLLLERYPDAAARDAAFAAKQQEYRAEYDARLALTRGACPPNDVPYCDSLLSVVEEERDEELRLLEQQRATVAIGG